VDPENGFTPAFYDMIGGGGIIPDRRSTEMAPEKRDPPQAAGVQRYFQKIYADYQTSVEKAPVLDVHQRIKRVIEPRLAGIVVDVGSGGDTRHRSPAITALISVDNVLEFLQHAKDPAALNAAGDVRALPFKKESVDRIVIQFVVHHLTDEGLAGTLRNVKAAISESARILKPGGRIFIVDSMTWRPLDMLQRAVYPMSRAILHGFGRPMVFILSASSLVRLCAESGLAAARPVIVDWGAMTDLSQALFPNLRFPLRYTPARLTILEAVRRTDEGPPDRRKERTGVLSAGRD
jgi:SAM-dependent methyltransferase